MARAGYAEVARGLLDWKVITHGPKAAAWLVKRFGRSLLLFGTFRVEIPLGRERPEWFDLALRAMRARPHVWRVVEVKRLGRAGTRVSVHWLMRGKF